MKSRRTLYIETLSNRDHRTLFSEAEVAAALSNDMPLQEAEAMARELLEGPVVPGHPVFFLDRLLEQLSEVSPAAAERVRIARNS